MPKNNQVKPCLTLQIGEIMYDGMTVRGKKYFIQHAWTSRVEAFCEDRGLSGIVLYGGTSDKSP